MVKPDPKHNYYADLELPSTCTIDEVKKQYRRLALLYHPDRNAGREEEVVPKFQGIQTAHEVLSDPALKSKYDTDRRKAGLYPTFRPGQQTQASSAGYTPPTSAYPPPPRRTQPATWQRPAPATGTTPTGADRFTNFTRGAPTARKDPTADRSSKFKAWQNLNTAQERQQQQQAPPTSPSRPRPPPRNGTKMPSEDEIRAGMNYRKAPGPPPPSAFDPGLDARQTAWHAYQQSQGKGAAGVSRSNTTRTPKKPGFDPNVPGSDERPAGDSGYAHRHRSEDFGRVPPGSFPPPPPGPPPGSSPTSPTASRPHGDPLRPTKGRDSDAPYSEGNRKRTPYTSSNGEKTPFTRQDSEGLRRTASTRDTTKLDPKGGSAGRARSTSPLGRHATTKGHTQHNDGQPGSARGKSWVNYSDSDITDDGISDSDLAEEMRSTTTTPAGDGGPSRPGTAPQSSTPFERPKKVPTPPSRRFPFSPPGQTDGATQSETERQTSNGGPGMQQKNGNNMYVPTEDNLGSDPFDAAHDGFSSDKMFEPFESETWRKKMFGTSTGTDSTLGAGRRVPRWAMPSSVLPESGGGGTAKGDTSKPPKRAGKSEGGPVYLAHEQQNAFVFVRAELEKGFGEVPESFDMDAFLQLALTVHHGKSCGHMLVDKMMRRTLTLFPYFALHIKLIPATHIRDVNTKDADRNHDRFSFPFHQEFSNQAAKSRSEEQINTKFTPEGWSGQFAANDYFSAAPPSPMGRKGRESPGRRQKSGLRSATTAGAHVPDTNGNGAAAQTPAEVRFSKEQWEKTFQDASWTWPPPPPPNVPASLSGRGARMGAGGRKGSKTAAATRPASEGHGTKQQPHVVEDDDSIAGVAGRSASAAEDAGNVVDEDAMDIDTTPPALHNEQARRHDGTPTQEGGKEPRMYAVPPSTWRQQQQQTNGNGPVHRHSVSGALAGGKLRTNLDDLANVEPIAPKTNAAGLGSLADVGSTLPFTSQASNAPPVREEEHQSTEVQLPSVPRAPEPPSKLTKASWVAFAASFSAYLQAFHEFNATILQHFITREHNIQPQLTTGTAWLEAAGDVSGVGGFRTYMQGVRDDEKVRELWVVGCERHAEAVKGFEKIRERVRKLGMGGGLVDQ